MRIKELVSEFKAFVLKGNVVDLAVGVVIGTAFGKVVDSVVKDLITPLIGVFGGQPNFASIHLGPLAIGNFINALLSFLILAVVVFFVVLKPINALTALARRKEEAKPAPVPADVQLLTEIRDLLKERRGI